MVIRISLAGGKAAEQVDMSVKRGGDHTGDYTAAVLELLGGLHGCVRQTEDGNCRYAGVSATSLHLLLKSNLPGKEILWAWYSYFDSERGQSVYCTLAPWEDEILLAVLGRCKFTWNAEVVRASGLVFLREHYREVILCLGDVIGMRLDAFATMDDEELRGRLRPGLGQLPGHIGRLVRELRLRPLELEQRRALNATLSSDYLRATASALLERAQSEAFWQEPPASLSLLMERSEALQKRLLKEAHRLGLTSWENGGRHAGQFHSPLRGMGQHLAVLGLSETAELEEIRAAYRRLAKENHPDQGGTIGDFLRVQEAYEQLIARWQ